MEKKIRDSNLELLRIIAMYMIVFIHANKYLGLFCEGISAKFFNGLVNGICNTGVTCFILISGYFGIRFDLRKLVKMECMMIMFSLLQLPLMIVIFPGKMQGSELLEEVVKACMPFVTRKYWFYSCYVVLVLFSGFIDRWLLHLGKREYQKLLALFLFLFSVLPTFFYFEIMQDTGKGLVQMMMIYLIGRYIRNFYDVNLPPKKIIPLFFLLWTVNGVSHELPIRIGGIYHHLCKDNSITNIFMAILLFYLFKQIKIQSVLINKAASYIFAVFALNNTLVTCIMEAGPAVIPGWPKSGSAWNFIYLASIVLAVLIISILAGMVQELLFEQYENKMGNLAVHIQEKLTTRRR